MLRPDLKKLSQFATTCCYKNLTSRILTSSRCGNYYGKEDATATAAASSNINSPIRIKQRVGLCQLGRNDIKCCTNCTQVNNSIWSASKKSAFWVPDHATSWFERERECRRQRHQTLLEQCKLFGITSATTTTTTTTTNNVKVVQPVRNAPLVKQRLDPKKFKRISPEFFKLLQQYDDAMVKHNPAYALPPELIKHQKRRRRNSPQVQNVQLICQCTKSSDAISIDNGPTWYTRPHAHGYRFYDQLDNGCDDSSSKTLTPCPSVKNIKVKTKMLTDNEDDNEKLKQRDKQRSICNAPSGEITKLLAKKREAQKAESLQGRKDAIPKGYTQSRKDAVTKDTEQVNKKFPRETGGAASPRNDGIKFESHTQGKKDAMPQGKKVAMPQGRKVAMPQGRKEVMPQGKKELQPCYKKDACPKTETIEIYKPKKFFSCCSPKQDDSASDICAPLNTSRTNSEDDCTSRHDNPSQSCGDDVGTVASVCVVSSKGYPASEKYSMLAKGRFREVEQKPMAHGYLGSPNQSKKNLHKTVQRTGQKKAPPPRIFEYKYRARARSPPKQPERETGMTYKPKLHGYPHHDTEQANRNHARETAGAAYSKNDDISFEPHAHGYHAIFGPKLNPCARSSAINVGSNSSLKENRKDASHKPATRSYDSKETTRNKSPTTYGIFHLDGKRDTSLSPKAHGHQQEILQAHRKQSRGASPNNAFMLSRKGDFEKPHAHGYHDISNEGSKSSLQAKKVHGSTKTAKKDKRETSLSPNDKNARKVSDKNKQQLKNSYSKEKVSKNQKKHVCTCQKQPDTYTDKECQTPSYIFNQPKMGTVRKSKSKAKVKQSNTYRYGEGPTKGKATTSRRNRSPSELNAETHSRRRDASLSKSDHSLAGNTSSRFASAETEASTTSYEQTLDSPTMQKHYSESALSTAEYKGSSKKPKTVHGLVAYSASGTSLESNRSHSQSSQEDHHKRNSKNRSRSRTCMRREQSPTGRKITDVNPCRHKLCYHDAVDWTGVSKNYPCRYRVAAKGANIDEATLRKHRLRNTSSSRINEKSPHRSRSSSRHGMCRKDSYDWRGVSKNYPVRYRRAANESKIDRATIREHRARNPSSSRINDKGPHVTKSRHDMCRKDSHDWRGVSKNYPVRYRKAAKETVRDDVVLEKHKETVYRSKNAENERPLYHRADGKSKDRKSNDRHKTCKMDSTNWSHATTENYPHRYRALAATQAKECRNVSASRALYRDTGNRYNEFEQRERVPLATVYGPVVGSNSKAHGSRAVRTAGKENNLKGRALKEHLDDRYSNYGPDYILGRPTNCRRRERYA